MSKLLKTNGVYGSRVGGRIVFTQEGAISLYKMFLDVCCNPLTPESAYVFLTWDEVEQIEIEHWKGMN